MALNETWTKKTTSASGTGIFQQNFKYTWILNNHSFPASVPRPVDLVGMENERGVGVISSIFVGELAWWIEAC